MSKRVANSKAKTARNGRTQRRHAEIKRRRIEHRERVLEAEQERDRREALRNRPPKQSLMQKVGQFFRPQKRI